MIWSLDRINFTLIAFMRIEHYLSFRYVSYSNLYTSIFGSCFISPVRLLVLWLILIVNYKEVNWKNSRFDAFFFFWSNNACLHLQLSCVDGQSPCYLPHLNFLPLSPGEFSNLSSAQSILFPFFWGCLYLMLNCPVKHYAVLKVNIQSVMLISDQQLMWFKKKIEKMGVLRHNFLSFPVHSFPKLDQIVFHIFFFSFYEL